MLPAQQGCLLLAEFSLQEMRRGVGEGRGGEGRGGERRGEEVRGGEGRGGEGR